MRYLRPAIIALLALGALVANWPGGDSARAEHGVTGDFVDIVAIDTDITNEDASTSGAGNTATEVGPIDACNSIGSVGGTLVIDVIVDEVPPFNAGLLTGGLTAFAFNMLYDPTVIIVTALDTNMLLAALGRSPSPHIERVPDTDGDFRVDDGDLTLNIEDGEGVLARIEIEAVGPGSSPLALDDVPGGDGIPDVFDAQLGAYTINNVLDGVVVVGGACVDSDGDGVFDPIDMCPDDPEDIDGVQDADGCPETDADGDGIDDDVDGCPEDPEDFDGFEDADGCPDPDHDGDGVFNSIDNCPADPNPDQADADGDGWGDACDVCPSEPGSVTNGGCPFPPSIGGIVEVQRGDPVQSERSASGSPLPLAASVTIGALLLGAGGLYVVKMRRG